MHSHSSTTSPSLTPDLVATELAAAASLLRAAAPLPPMMVTYSPRKSWRLALAPEETVAAARQQVAVKRLAARMGADLARLSDSTPWARGTWRGTGVFVSTQRIAGDHVGHGDTAEHADMLDALTGWVYEMAAAGAQEIWVHQPRIAPLHPDHRLRASVHADPELTARLAVLSDELAGRPRQGAWAGSALTSTGHDVVIVRT